MNVIISGKISELSAALGIGTNTIRRWCAGTTKPHPAIMPSIMEEINKLKIRNIEIWQNDEKTSCNE